MPSRLFPFCPAATSMCTISVWNATALNSLSDEHRTVIVALFYQRRTVAEVAALLSIPEGTVRSRCFYGLRALRKTLEEQGITRP